ncbi:MAG TPA: hypothetical protein VGO68_20905 [Pyrinomonadaceae bacterium]|jgi:hypothetical protein|nr:hypothetical protein [Pyrinomonadaceae bacterium]
MTSTRLKIFAMTALLSVAATALGDNSADQTLQQVAGYREWTRLTHKPIVVDLSTQGFTIGAGDGGG